METTLIILGGAILIVFLLREVVAWYFKINDIVKLLTEIRDLLKNRPT